MNSERPQPDDLLAAIQKEEAKQKRGKLKIFLGMCPGVGKTYSMLQAARQRQAEGIDVLVGVVETHGRKETEILLEGLAVASKVEKPYRGVTLQEMDLDTILAIRPQLAIVDELAHTNIPGSRHPKRYQDVLELLSAGIDVYTTLNVQHVESRAETVAQITGIRVQETVPDSLLDEAEEIMLIDLSAEQLRQRLKEGKVYMGERAATASENFFKEENLIALREMALRLTADRVNQELREIMTEQRIQGPWKSSERLMVAIGPTPYSESLIRWTRRAAASLNAPWTAVYVDISKALSDEENKRLTRNLALARQLGAEVIVRSGTDVAQTLIQVARQNNVSQICVGKPSERTWWGKRKGASLVQRLIEKSGDIDIHMVRVKGLGVSKGKAKSKIEYHGSSPISGREYLAAVVVVIVVTLICFFLEKMTGYSSVSLIYLLAVVISGMYLSRWPVLLLGASSAIVWNFLFIPPRFTFLIYKTYDVVMFSMFFVVALAMGHVTTRLREREQAQRKQEEKVQTLYQLTRTIAVTHDSKEAIQNALLKLEEVLNVQAAIFLADVNGEAHFEKPENGSLLLSRKEKSVANWTFQKQQSAGRFTDTLPDADHFYLPIVSLNKTLGVLAIHPLDNRVWTLDQRNLMESFASLITVILEKNLLTRMTQDAQIKAESEKLQTALLDSVSHELKTPLTIIAGSVEHLAKQETNSNQSQKLLSEISTASHRLLQTVNGLLDMTRLDSGKFKLSLEWHDMHDVMRTVTENLSDQLKNHHVYIKFQEILPLVKIDINIIRQVLANLLSNAAVYSPQNTNIHVSIYTDEKVLVISVSDQGPGIPKEDWERIFEKFYRGKNTKPGGLGLGLSIAKRLAEVHGGYIEVSNQEEGGACFVVRLPVEFFDSKGKELL
jgi:two-component system sensor histidine kinase KdpD